MTAHEKGLALLANLGKPTARPKAPPFAAFEKLCHCGAQVLMAKLPSGKWAPLDRAPEGELVIVNGVAVTAGETHGAADRWTLHFSKCREASKGER